MFPSCRRDVSPKSLPPAARTSHLWCCLHSHITFHFFFRFLVWENREANANSRGDASGAKRERKEP